MRRLAAVLMAVGLLAALTIAHWHFWYRPRARAMAPAASVLLPRSPAGEVRLWIPYPHQNLGALERAAEDPEALLAAVARLAGLPPPTLPRLEPFGLPPARELQVSSSVAGEALAVEMLPYPVVRWTAGLAGRLAGNPLLAGGEAEVGGRPVVVHWDRAIWSAREEVGAATSGSVHQSAPAANRQPILALLELPVASPPLPAGHYRWLLEGRDLVVTSRAESAGGLEAAASLADQEDLVLLFLRRQQEGGLEALVLFDRESGLVPGFPSAAVLAASREGERLLPGGRALSRLGRLPARETAEGTLLATDRWALERAAELEPLWRRLEAAPGGPGELEVGIWIAAEPAAIRSRRLLRFLEGFPLTPAQELQRWRDGTRILEATAERYRFLEAWATRDAAELRATALPTN